MNNDTIKLHYIKLLEAQAKKSGLSGLEKIKKIYIEPKLFSDYDLITTTYKIKRHQAKKQFQEIIDKLYVGLD